MDYYNLKKIIKHFCYKNHLFQNIPPRILIMLTTPRSGSTWFLDAIRCHPSINFLPSAVIFPFLGMQGRRYPRDLSNGPDAVLDIEIKPEKYEKIPDFGTKFNFINEIPKGFADKNFFIEKCHPEFFNFDFSYFIRRINKLEDKNINIKFIYLVRNPSASINSFLKYQGRNPTWYPNTKGSSLITYMQKSFMTILEIAKQQPGIIVDYSNLIFCLETKLNQVYSYIWPNLTSEEHNFNLHISDNALEVTNRVKRSKTRTTFLGEKVGSVENKIEDLNSFSNKQKDEIAKIYEHYDLLMDIKTKQKLT